MGVRHIQVIFGWLSTTMGYVLRADMSVAVIAMVDTKFRDEEDNGSNVITFQWDESKKNLLLSCFFWLYIVCAIPSGMLAEKYGAKLMLGLCVGLASVCTLLIPVAAYVFSGYEFEAILILRILNGMMQSGIFPTTNVLISRWVTPEERSQSLALCFSGGFFGPLIGFSLSGYLASTRFGWPSIFCASGGLGLLWTFLWIYLGGSSYEESRIVSKGEMSYIRDSIQHDVTIKHASRTPWRKILSSRPVLAIVISHFGFNFGYFFLLTQAPNYLYNVLNVDVANSGLLNTLPYATGCIALPIYSMIHRIIDRHYSLPHTRQRKFWNSVSLWGGALPILILCIFSVKYTTIVLILLIISVTCLTAEYYGYLTNHIHLSPNFGGTLLGLSNTVANFGSFLPPLCVGWIVKDVKSMEDWKPVFLLVTVVMFLSNLFYIIFGTSALQSWNEVVEKSNDNKEQKR